LQSYDWNYAHAPTPQEVDVPAIAGDWQFCGLPVDSPLGIPAGPLLNGSWCLYYASLGFDVLTYKTVRSSERPCYPLPNLQPVRCSQLSGGEVDLPAIDEMQGSWAVSFGMPSKSPDVWRADIAQTRKSLPTGKLLSVSVVGTVQEGWTIDELAADYARCAKWAVESGADCVETNFSCPNVATCDGQLHQLPDDARIVAEAIRSEIGQVPYIAKTGRIEDESDAAALLDAIGTAVDALAMTNSIASTVRTAEGALLFEGQCRGICGDATRNASISQTSLFQRLVREKNLELQLIGVGGVSSEVHVKDYLAAGAHAVHIASAAMVKPSLTIDIRGNW
jgi:dihydroorotate dehydrogenase (NAD+) catalytic subunit